MKNSIVIEMQGRSGVLYKSNEDHIKISGEIIVNPLGFMIFKDSIDKWEKTNRMILEKEKEEIIKNIRMYFNNQNFSISVY